MRDRQLVPMRNGVYRFPGAPATFAQQICAITLSGAGDVAASHRTANQLWGFGPREWNVLEVTVGAKASARISGVKVHRTDLLAAHVTSLYGIVLTTPAYTLINLAAVAPRAALEIACDNALRQRAVTLPQLTKTFAEYKRGGRTSASFEAMLVARTKDKTQSDLERLALRWIRKHNISGLAAHFEIVVDGIPLHPDIAFPAERVLVECQGYNPHFVRTVFDDDAQRFAGFAAQGWRVIPLTTRMTEREFIRLLQSALNRGFVQKDAS